MSDKNDMPVKRRKSVKKKKSVIHAGNLNMKLIGIIIAVIVVILAIVFGIRGCSVKQNSPQSVVKSMINNMYKGNMKNVKKCYDLNGIDVDELDKEIEAQMKYFEVHNAKGMEIVDVGVLYDSEAYSYVYITYNLLLEDDQKYPCVRTYMVTNLDGKYYIVPTAKITEDMSNTASEKYGEFTNSKTYKTYLTTYDTFIKKNPGYEDRISDKIK